MRATVYPLLAAVLAAPLAVLPPAEAEPPAQLAPARYVALGYERGDRFVSEIDVRQDFLPEERAALQTIRAQIAQWGRYVVVDRLGQADLRRPSSTPSGSRWRRPTRLRASPEVAARR
jgi:hypothetical protein